MLIGEEIAATLGFLRGQAESRMGAERGGSTVTIRRRSGQRIQDEGTGKKSPEWVAPHADLPMRLDFTSSSDGGSRTEGTDGVEVETATALGHFPALTADLRDGDYIDITAGEGAGEVWRIVKAVRGDQKTTRRVPIRSDTRPAEWGF